MQFITAGIDFSAEFNVFKGYAKKIYGISHQQNSQLQTTIIPYNIDYKVSWITIFF